MVKANRYVSSGDFLLDFCCCLVDSNVDQIKTTVETLKMFGYPEFTVDPTFNLVDKSCKDFVYNSIYWEDYIISCFVYKPTKYCILVVLSHSNPIVLDDLWSFGAMKYLMKQYGSDWKNGDSSTMKYFFRKNVKVIKHDTKSGKEEMFIEFIGTEMESNMINIVADDLNTAS